VFSNRGGIFWITLLFESCFYVSFCLTNIICIAICTVYSVHYTYDLNLSGILSLTFYKLQMRKITFNSIWR